MGAEGSAQDVRDVLRLARPRVVCRDSRPLRRRDHVPALRALRPVSVVRPDSALQWWRRLFRVFPAGDSEPGSVSAPSLVTPTRCPVAGSAWFPLATMTCDPSLPAPPHTASRHVHLFSVRGVLP